MGSPRPSEAATRPAGRRRGAPVAACLVLVALLASPLPGADPAARIDELVAARLARDGIVLPPPCDDATFLRRLCLDVLAILPPPAVGQRFQADGDPARREAAIDRALARPEHADWWAWRWSDLLRVKAEFPSNLWPLGAVATHRWLRQSMLADLRFDAFAAALVTASGSGFRHGPVNLYRAVSERTPEAMAEAVALVLLGTRIEEAGWPPGIERGFAACFAGIAFKPTGEWKEEVVLWDPSAVPAGTPPPCAPDGTPLAVEAGADPRPALAAWLSGPGRLHLARAMANRTWTWLTGRGLVVPVDDLRPGNAPWCPELLDHLAGVLIGSGWDHRALVRTILRSRTWQARSGVPGGYPIRRLDAEVLLDAVCQVTGVGERWVSQIPEPFTVIPDGAVRAVALPDGSISCTFLEVFGRPPRATALDAERSSAPSVLQAQRMLNSPQVHGKLSASAFLRRLAGGSDDPVPALYERILCRAPDADERRIAAAALAGRSRAEAVMDLAWVLINSTEFATAH